MIAHFNRHTPQNFSIRIFFVIQGGPKWTLPLIFDFYKKFKRLIWAFSSSSESPNATIYKSKKKVEETLIPRKISPFKVFCKNYSPLLKGKSWKGGTTWNFSKQKIFAKKNCNILFITLFFCQKLLNPRKTSIGLTLRWIVGFGKFFLHRKW